MHLMPHASCLMPHASCLSSEILSSNYPLCTTNAQFSFNEFISFECGICANGTIFFNYRNINNFVILELDNIGITIGLWHGRAKDEFLEMAAEQVDIQALKANLTMLGLVVRFSPLTICSLTNTCLTSPECPHYSSLHGCSILSCQEPSDLPVLLLQT